MNKIEIYYHDKDLPRIEQIEVGNWIDLRASSLKVISSILNNKYEVSLSSPFNYIAGMTIMVNLGISMNIGNMEAHLVPRSSTFKKYGLIQTNHMGVIDSSYCGQDDVWWMPCYALKPGTINYGDRICQFRLVEPMGKVEIKEVESLSSPSRGGFGSTGSS